MRNISYKQLRDRLTEAAKISKTPLLVHFELTARCNLDCKMCYVHTQDNASALRRELSTDQWKHIFDEAYDAGMVYASLSGGECLVRKDFKELYLYLWNKHVYVSVLTNGTLLNEEYIEFFKTYRPDMIQISLYGSSEENYINVTGHTGFEKAKYAISSLEAANIDVRVSVTTNKYMGDDYINILQFCNSNGFVIADNGVNLVSNRDDPNKDDYFLSIEEAVSLLKKRAELYSVLIPVDNTPEPFGPMLKEPDIGLTCKAGNCLATITWDGKMYPCFNAMVGEGASLIDMSYRTAWSKTVEAASKVVYGRECVDCAYNETCHKCPAMRLTDLSSGHCKSSMCELTRRLVASGIKKLIPLTMEGSKS